MLKVYCLVRSNSNLKNYKRIKRKCNKKYIYVKNEETYLEKFKKIIKSHSSNDSVGIVCDNVYLFGDQYSLPDFPNQWSVLFNNYTIKSYDYKNEYNNTYWVSSKTLTSYDFILHHSIIQNLKEHLDKFDKWSELLVFLNTYENTFTLTQYPLSEKNDKIYNEESELCDSEIEQVSCLDLFNSYPIKQRNELLPSISLICPLTSSEFMSNVIFSFLKLNYPRHKLELLIVDTKNSDKEIKKLLPDDSRIKLIKIDNVGKDKDDVSLGYMFNTAVKYGSKELIAVYLDNIVYNSDYLFNLVTSFLMSKAEGIYSSIETLIFTKSLWKTMSFVENTNNKKELLYNFLYMRTNVVIKTQDYHKTFEDALLDEAFSNLHNSIKLVLTKNDD
jgi:hypothetical protein